MDVAVACAACSSGWFNFLAGAAVALSVQAGGITWSIATLKHVLPPQIHMPLLLSVSFAKILAKIAVLRARKSVKHAAAFLASLGDDGPREPPNPAADACNAPVKSMRRPREIPQALTSSLGVPNSDDAKSEKS